MWAHAAWAPEVVLVNVNQWANNLALLKFSTGHVAVANQGCEVHDTSQQLLWICKESGPKAVPGINRCADTRPWV